MLELRVQDATDALNMAEEPFKKVFTPEEGETVEAEQAALRKRIIGR